ncbi:MAG: hypothetical protein HY335_03270, partial [Deinococcus sp.]|nr:hypothetical protein [Deinococcus sp.]
AEHPENGPIHFDLPIIEGGGARRGQMTSKRFTAYHHNVRANSALQMQEEGRADQLPGEQVLPFNLGPSLTFQGVPDISEGELAELMEEFAETQPDEEEFQPSVVNIIGGQFQNDRQGRIQLGDGQLEASYFGFGQGAPSVLEGLRRLLERHFDQGKVDELMSLTPANYLLYSALNYQFLPEVPHPELPVERVSPGDLPARNHVAGRFFRPVMVADDTIFDPTPGVWLIPDWFSIVDAAANQQNLYLFWAQIGPDIPFCIPFTSPCSFLIPNNNRIIAKTEVAQYRVLTPLGESLLAPAHTNNIDLCSGAQYFLDEVRKLSLNFLQFNNEYWMWFTRDPTYGNGGCGYIGTLGRTPFDYATAVTGLLGATLDRAKFVFMHESGHVFNATHNTNAAGSPETFDSHQCRLLGIWPFGPVGPSLMSYAAGTRTFCYATTPPGGPRKNITQVAEYLHFNGLLLP